MLALIFGLNNFTAQAADPNKAHNHKGERRFTDPAGVALHTEATLNSGKTCAKAGQGADDGGRGIAIFDVDASEQIVWGVLTSFTSWLDRWAGCLPTL